MSAQLYKFAERFVGEVRELPGATHDPFIQFCFTKCGYGPETPDEIAWCSAFINGLAWLLRLPRSKSAAARSWLTVGTPVELDEARVGDVVIIKRGAGVQPGPEVTSGAPGHVFLFASIEALEVLGLGGNQGNQVSIARFAVKDVLGVRRLV
jgi:uncharacterized protein (TIGR02594 family)